jgi:cyclic pyranopterin phosphate synthase
MIRDALRRPLRSLRISVTDRCNLRCSYCMPEEHYAWLPRHEVLSYEEIARLVTAFCDAGVTRVRLTGGEPLIRRDLEVLLRLLAAEPRLAERSLTTNGVELAGRAEPLRDAGLQRITVSLDTLRPDRFRALTRRDDHGRVLAGIAAARAAGLPLKLDTVILRGVNDDEILDLLAFARDAGAELRFIEYMDVGGATRWSPEQVVGRDEILERVRQGPGEPTPLPGRGSAPAERFALPDGSTFGVIGTVTAPFCGACDRGRLTADGTFFLCLYARKGTSLRDLLRAGRSGEELAAHIQEAWQGRQDRGAEDRLGMARRGPLALLPELQADPHLEMHTRGG